MFISREVVAPFVVELARCAEAFECLVPIYCFMPDHLHAMLQGTDERSAPKKAMDAFKARTNRWLKDIDAAFELQKDYHDHIVRRSDDWRRHAFYILNNPVRAGLTEDPYAYPSTGSIGYDLPQMFADLTW